MAQIHTTATHLAVRLTGARRIFGRWRPLAFGWDQVVRAGIDPEAARAFPGARWGVATNIPGTLNLGSFRKDGGLAFWDVANPDRAIVIDLDRAKFDRLILEVDDPEATLADIRAHLDHPRH